MSQSEFMADIKTVHAVERCISIIGEAANKLSGDVQQASPDVPWRDIRGMRNRVVHDYSRVNLDIVWNIVQYELPDLIDSCTRLLEIQE